jgi:electron transfer flavoprotein beta subunit
VELPRGRTRHRVPAHVSIVACLKWVAHPGEPGDERFAGMSSADRSALEFALRQAEALRTSVTVVTVGPVGAEHVLRDALACGATRAIRVHTDRQLSSADVAVAIASAVGETTWVWCGDYSLDRGTGSVPAFLAAHLDARQALGVIAIDPDHGGHGEIGATRRLDGGRRELLTVSAPAVVSVEGATAPLRRASLIALRTAAGASIEVVAPTASLATHNDHDGAILPYRPRARAVAAPRSSHPLDRLRTLTDIGGSANSSARGEQVELSPADAAAHIVATLRSWGYLATHD